MAKTFKLEVITPERKFYEGEVEMVIVHTVEGEEGFEARHTPACMMLDIGELRIHEEGHKIKYAVTTDGFVDVTDQGMIVFVSEAMWPDEIDTSSFATRKKELKEKISHPKDYDEVLIEQFSKELRLITVQEKVVGRTTKK